MVIRDHSAVNDEDEDSNTALHLATLHGHTKVALILIKNGADVAARWVFPTCKFMSEIYPGESSQPVKLCQMLNFWQAHVWSEFYLLRPCSRYLSFIYSGDC